MGFLRTERTHKYRNMGGVLAGAHSTPESRARAPASQARPATTIKSIRNVITQLLTI